MTFISKISCIYDRKTWGHKQLPTQIKEKNNKFSIQCFCSGQNFEFTSRANDWTTWLSNTDWLVTGIPLGSAKQGSVKTKGLRQT